MNTINLNKAELRKLPKDDLQKLYIACESFKAGGGFEIFFDHIKNLYVSSTLGLNDLKAAESKTLITDEYFRGGLAMLQFIQDQVTDYSLAKDLSKTVAKQTS